MSADTATQTRPRRAEPAVPRRLLLTGRRGDTLTATTPSESAPGVWHEQAIPLDPARPVTCGPTCKARGRHWHTEEAERLRDEYLAIRAVQAGLSRRTLLQTAEDTHPDNLRHPFAGAVTLTWLAAMQTLEERGALGKAVAA